VVPVPGGFDAAGLEARLSAGVLAVMVPRHEASGHDPGDAFGDRGEWSGD
jgi:HSP20 family molecular chaperone IbpA